MAVANHAASVQGVCLRITRLAADGTPMKGVTQTVYVCRSFMRVSFTPEFESGDEITEKNASGEVCISYKASDTLKRVTMELAICEPDPEITELLSGGLILEGNATGDPLTGGYPDVALGYAGLKVGQAPNPNGVGIEVWSVAVRDGAKDNALPYYRWVFPKVELRPSGDRVIENGVLANTFEGFGVGNINFGTGPVDDWPWPDATDRCYLYARDKNTGFPTNPDGTFNVINGWLDNSTKTPIVGTPDSPDIVEDPNLLGHYEYPAEKPTYDPLVMQTVGAKTTTTTTTTKSTTTA